MGIVLEKQAHVSLCLIVHMSAFRCSIGGAIAENRADSVVCVVIHRVDVTWAALCADSRALVGIDSFPQRWNIAAAGAI